MRILIISDIHGNLLAFDAVLDAAPAYDQVWCLGDLVGYGPNPRECIHRLQELSHLTVAGNHDRAVTDKLNLDEFNADAQEAALWTRNQLSDAELDFLAQLPEQQAVGDFTLVHGSPRHPVWEYILAISTARANFDYFDTPFCLVGHTHVPIIYTIPRSETLARCKAMAPRDAEQLALPDTARMIINPGSVGQPRDGIPLASYALLDTETRLLSFHRQPYAIEEIQEQMHRANLPPRLIARLSFGW